MNTTTPAINKPVPGPHGKFLSGSLPAFIGYALKVSYKGFLKYGDIVRYHPGPRIVYIGSYPNIAHSLLIEKSRSFPRNQSKGG